MRILHVLDHSIPLHSGYSFRTLAILREQRALGWDTVHVTGTKHTVATRAVEEVDGYVFHRTLPTGGLMERLPVLDQLAVIRGLAQRVRALIGECRPDVVHAHSPSLNGVAALIAARPSGVPVVYEMRALWEDGAVDHGVAGAGGWRYRAARALETWVLRRADAVTTICEGLRGEIAARGIPGWKLSVIPNAVDSGRFASCGAADPVLRRRLRLENCAVVGFLGSFYRYEGLALLLAAMPAMLSRRPDIRLLLVGGGYEEDRLKQQARTLGIADKVIFAGRVPHDQIQAFYPLVDVCVYPRERTRLTELVTPLKPLEAMAQGRPVVASDVGGHHELMRPGENALMFRAGDARALCDAVLQVLGDAQLAATLSENGRRYVETERSWTSSVARYAEVYAKAVAGGHYRFAH